MIVSLLLLLFATSTFASASDDASTIRKDCNVYAAIFGQYHEDSYECNLAKLIWGKSEQTDERHRQFDTNRALKEIVALIDEQNHHSESSPARMSSIVDADADSDDETRRNIEYSIERANGARRRLAETLMRIERDVESRLFCNQSK